MSFRFLDFQALRDFNYSAGLDPDLGPGSRVSEQLLLRWAVEVRSGERGPLADLIDAMHTTLCPAAFETFQRLHGPRPITYSDFFFSKLHQYCSLLIHDSIQIADDDAVLHPAQSPRPWEEAGGRAMRAASSFIDPEELEAAFDPGEDHQPWYHLVLFCRDAAPGQRLEQLTAYLHDVARARSKVDHRKVEGRDELIARLARTGADRLEICAALDRAGIPVTSQMKKAGIRTWQEADDCKDLRRNIQTLIAKAKQKPVKG